MNLGRFALVASDVADDRRRSDLRDNIAWTGFRIQHSLWVLPSLKRAELGRWAAMLSRHTGSYDRLLIWRPCAPCSKAVRSDPECNDPLVLPGPVHVL